MDKKAFTQHRDNGVYLQFPNGNGLSTVWGAYTYSENYHIDGELPSHKEDIVEYYKKSRPSNTVEVMPNCSDKMLKKLAKAFPEEENGSVFGHLTIDKWLKMVNMLYKEKTI